MENSNLFVKEGNQVNGEKPPARVCPRCNSDNTKFCYYNNYSLSQPRYSCKNCRRYWTHGGALRNIPVGGSSRKKPTNIVQPSTSQVHSINIPQQINHYHPFLNIQENNGFLESFDGSSSSIANIGNHYGPFPHIHGDSRRNFGQMEASSNFAEGSFRQNYVDVAGSNDLIGNPLINQSIGGYVNNPNIYRVNHEDPNKWYQNNPNSYHVNEGDPNKWYQNFNNSKNMNNIASTSGSGESPLVRKCILRSAYHLDKPDP